MPDPTTRNVRVHLNVEVPADDTRSAQEIAAGVVRHVGITFDPSPPFAQRHGRASAAGELEPTMSISMTLAEDVTELALTPEGRAYAEAHPESMVAVVALQGYVAGWPEGHVTTAIEAVNAKAAEGDDPPVHYPGTRP